MRLRLAVTARSDQLSWEIESRRQPGFA